MTSGKLSAPKAGTGKASCPTSGSSRPIAISAIGAEFLIAGTITPIKAAETIVCCGGLNSPTLLMRSGIGPADHLRDHDIAVVADRRGVGQNLMEHPSLSVSTYISARDRLSGDKVHHVQACLRLSSELAGADPNDLHFQILAKSAWHEIGRRLGTIFFWINKSYSRGEVRLRSKDYKVAPDIDFRLLSDIRDRRRMMQCVRFAGEVLNDLHRSGAVAKPFPTVFSDRVRKASAVNATNAMQLSAFGLVLDMAGTGLREWLIRNVMTEGPPLDLLLSDSSALEQFVMKSVGGTWHATGTCKMGADGDRMAVTDSHGRILDVNGLRVCDGSLMPSLPRANTNIPIIMMAERISDLAKSES